MRHAVLALVLLAGCPKKTAPIREPEPAYRSDRDGDGVLDMNDACPDDATDDPEAGNGCPTGADRDGDVIADSVDKCPDDPEDHDAFADEDGCPEPDNDRDGTLDVDDICPNDAEDKDGYADDDACPDPDNDKDGVRDAQDRCPNSAETKNGFSDDDGCPDLVTEPKIVDLRKPEPPPAPPPRPKKPADRDKDGFPDAQDKCPDEAETPNGVKDGDGCPD